MVVSNIQLRVNSTQAVKALNSANTAAAKLNATLQKSQGAMKSTQGTLRGMGSAGFGAAKGLNAGSVAAKGFGVALKTALGPISALLAGVGGITAAFQILSAQDFAEAKVETLGVNSDALRAKLKGVSAELQGQADVVELTSAAYDVASAGFASAAEASEVLSAAGKGAVGGFSDINTVADATTSVLNSYGLASDQAAKLVDGFIQTQNDGKIVIGEYAKNISKVAPVAAALKIPLEEVNAAVAQITGTGTGAEVTFTALKTAFAQLAAGGVGDKLKEFGLDISASSVAADGFVGTLEKIKASGADSGAVLKAFGTEAGPAILALLNDTEKLNQLLANQKDAQGAAAKAAFVATDTINGQVKRLQSAFTNLIAEQGVFGEAIKNALKIAAVTVEALASAFELLMVPTRAFNAIITEIGSAILSSLGTDGVETAMRLEEGFQNVRKVISQVADFAVGLARIVGRGIGSAIQNVLNVTEGLRKSLMDGFANTIMAIPRLLGNLYNALPDFAKALIDRVLGGAASKFREIAELGAGVMSGAQGPADAINVVQPTGGGLGSRSLQGKTDSNEDAKNAERIAKASAKRVQSLEDQALLASALTAEERQQFERQIKMRKLLEQKGVLTDDQLKKEVDALTNLFEQEDATARITAENKKQADAKAKAQAEEKKRTEELHNIYQGIGDTLADGVVNALKGAVDGTTSLAQAATSLLDDLANQMLQIARNMLFFGNLTGSLVPGGGILGSIFGGFLADGGTAKGGRSYVVGERGPELFTPGRTGSVTPNSALGGANVTVNVDASGSSAQGDGPQAKALGQAIGAAVQAELIKQKRPGGLLS